jgi:hypothetical protein
LREAEAVALAEVTAHRGAATPGVRRVLGALASQPDPCPGSRSPAAGAAALGAIAGEAEASQALRQLAALPCGKPLPAESIPPERWDVALASWREPGCWARAALAR